MHHHSMPLFLIVDPVSSSLEWFLVGSIHREPPDILDRLKALRAGGLGFDRIAARMNEEHIPSRTGKLWHGVVVNRILTGKR
jgi:hypothetical protein